MQPRDANSRVSQFYASVLEMLRPVVPGRGGQLIIFGVVASAQNNQFQTPQSPPSSFTTPTITASKYRKRRSQSESHFCEPFCYLTLVPYLFRLLRVPFRFEFKFASLESGTCHHVKRSFAPFNRRFVYFAQEKITRFQNFNLQTITQLWGLVGVGLVWNQQQVFARDQVH